jgi:hypothetical protein
MREPYGEGLASHADPESCVGVRKGAFEALTGARAGRVLSREILLSGCRRCAYKRKATSWASLCETLRNPARSETPCMCGNTSRENREVPCLTTVDGTGVRVGKSKDVIR